MRKWEEEDDEWEIHLIGPEDTVAPIRELIEKMLEVELLPIEDTEPQEFSSDDEY